jgi:hypothetical protein
MLNKITRRSTQFGVGRRHAHREALEPPTKPEIKEDQEYSKGGMTTLNPKVVKKEKKRMFQR